jgi:hypothetical protein
MLLADQQGMTGPTMNGSSGSAPRALSPSSRSRTIGFWVAVAIALFVAVGTSGRPSSAQSQQFGLEWPGNGSVRRMLYWSNPFPIYPATYLFRVLPRKKTCPTDPTAYYTTFFWGNNGRFDWISSGLGDTYYGMHPYPSGSPGAPCGAGHWEISVAFRDPTTPQEVAWDRWHVQAIRVWRVDVNTTVHEFHYDWDLTNPPTSCASPRCFSETVTDPTWATRVPPFPSIVVGQAPDQCGPPPCSTGLSWGGYPGWEEFNGVIRGLQFYSGLLSLADIQKELTTPKSSAAGAAAIWYLNVDPRPSDVTDKKGVGTPHNPAWGGTTALEWTSGASSPAPTAPSGLRVQ